MPTPAKKYQKIRPYQAAELVRTENSWICESCGKFIEEHRQNEHHCSSCAQYWRDIYGIYDDE